MSCTFLSLLAYPIYMYMGGCIKFAEEDPLNGHNTTSHYQRVTKIAFPPPHMQKPSLPFSPEEFNLFVISCGEGAMYSVGGLCHQTWARITKVNTLVMSERSASHPPVATITPCINNGVTGRQLQYLS